MWQTPFTRDYRLRYPFVGAGMAMIAEPPLVAAVCEAGGLGQLGTGPLPPPLLRDKISAVRALTSCPFGVNLIVETTAFGPATVDEHVAICAEERVPVVVFFWNAPPRHWVERLRRAGCRVWATVASESEARSAAALELDALIVQGREAGGHVRADEPLLALLPRVRAALGEYPLIAAGGIANGRSAAMALAAGAAAVCVGTRLVASEESAAHPGYKARLIAARSEDTVVTELFGPEWPGAPMRVLANNPLRRAAASDARCQAAPATIGETDVFGRHYVMPACSSLLPTTHTRGDLDEMCLAAGEGVAFVTKIEPAAAIVREMMDDASRALAEHGR